MVVWLKNLLMMLREDLLYLYILHSQSLTFRLSELDNNQINKWIIIQVLEVQNIKQGKKIENNIRGTET